MKLVLTTVGVLCDWNIESAGLFLRGNRKLLTKNGLISQRRRCPVRDTTGICDLSGPLWPIMAPRLGTGLAWSHLAIQKSIETKQRNFNVSQMPASSLDSVVCSATWISTTYGA